MNAEAMLDHAAGLVTRRRREYGEPRLNRAQILYAATDAVIPVLVRHRMEEDAGSLAARAFEIQNAAVPVAARMRLRGVEAVTPELRSAAKPVNFGAILGQRARGLAAYAWSAYRVEMTLEDANAALAAFFEVYPAIHPWQQRTYHLAQDTSVLRTWSGRPIRGAWHPRGELWWNKTCNHPVQGSCADAALIAMAAIERALVGPDAELIMMVHDEFVVEAAEDHAKAAAEVVEREMTAAFAEVFPEVPTNGLVEGKAVRCWADAKG